MALGSSAPEILLAVIELYANNYYSGKLGASTIVPPTDCVLQTGVVLVCLLVRLFWIGYPVESSGP